jgi:hypothetical protein
MIEPIKKAIWGSAGDLKILLLSYFKRDNEQDESQPEPQPQPEV